jgi:hypothetical protein
MSADALIEIKGRYRKALKMRDAVCRPSAETILPKVRSQGGVALAVCWRS